MLHSYKAPFHILFLARQSSNFSASLPFWLLKNVEDPKEFVCM